MEKKLIASISGIRGIVGETFTPDVIVKYAEAFARFSKRGKTIVGYDGRFHGAMLTEILKGTLVAGGCRVLDIGVCPTPTVELAVEHSDAAGGVMVTASHNPLEWNGLKFLNRKGLFLNADENKKLMAYAKGGVMRVNPRSIGTVSDGSFFLLDHLRRVLSIKEISLRAIRKRRFRVVVDAVNASGSVVVPELLREFGCKVIETNCEPTGIFRRKPEPLPENIRGAMKRVKREKADLGIVVDPDVDRLALLTEKGQPFGEEYTIVQVIDFLFKRLPKKERAAVVNLSTTRATDEVAKRRGGKVYRSAVGEINVVEKMRRVRAPIGGEGSGGVILPEVHSGRDALVGIALTLQNLLEFGGTLSEYKKTLPKFEIVKKKIETSGRNTQKFMRAVEKRYAGFKINKEDGLKIDAPDYWIHIRKSNTEPVMRIITEAKTRREAEAHLAEVVAHMEQAI